MLKKYFSITILFTVFLCITASAQHSKNNSLKKQHIKKNKHVIVIGAGISGLSAATYLKSKGISVTVLEAQNQVGGRLKTNRSLGIPFDEGASWIHGPKGNPITPIASEAKLTTFLTEDESVKVYNKNGIEYSTKKLAKAEKKFNQILNKLDNKGSRNKSFGEVFYTHNPSYKNNNLWTYMLSAFLEFDTGADIYKLSSLDYYDDESFTGKDLIITNGYDKLTNYLAKDINIKLNTCVLKIDYAKATIKVTTTNGDFYANQVLVTVPLGILKRNSIQFIPKLPTSTQKAINNLEMGTVNKFLLVWDTPFWDTDVQYIGYTPTTKGKFNYFLNLKKITNANVLMTFAFGDYSIKTETMSDVKITDEIMKHLQSIYGKTIPRPSKMLRTKWNSNSYTYGSYSFATNKTSTNDFEVFEQPIQYKIFFAGEHTIFDYRGTVHGAYLSGIREAKKIEKLQNIP